MSLRSFYWLLQSGAPGELFGGLFQSSSDEAAKAGAIGEAEACLPVGVHTIAVFALRGNGESYQTWRGDVVIGNGGLMGAVACA